MKPRKGDVVLISGDYQYNAIHSKNPIQRFWHYGKQLAIDRILPPNQKDFIFDIGCGSGVISSYLAKSGANVIGYDGNEEAIKFASSNYRIIKNLRFEQTIIEDNFKIENPADKIYCLELVEHIYWEQAVMLIKNIERMLKLGGKVFITTPNYKSLWPLIEKTMDLLKLAPQLKESQHIEFYDKNKLRKLIENNTKLKIKVLQSKYFLAPWFAIVHPKIAEKIHNFEMSFKHFLGSILILVAEKTVTE
jgi:2-polyprenyl-3-methyl-5-hydroxy-6-metoxy-1,4-benzoquinol methylase